MRPDDPRILTCAAALLGVLEALVVETVPSGDGDAYRSDGPLPPRTSRDMFNSRCRRGQIPGARKVGGRGFGFWEVDRAEWHRALAKRSTPAPLRVVETTPTDEERADAMIREAGFRLTKAAR